MLYILTSHIVVTRRPVLQKVRHHTLNSAMSARKHRVSGSFSLPSRGSFHLSLTVLYSIGHMVVFSLRRWSSFLPSGFLVSRRTPDSCSRRTDLSSTGLLPSLAALSNAIQLYSSDRLYGSATPDVRRLPVWPLPISLAATLRITVVFLSSGYLDVSVHRVPPIYLWIQYMVTHYYMC